MRDGNIIAWIIWILLTVLCVGAAIAGAIVGIRARKNGNGSSEPVASAYIAGTIGGPRAVSWTNARAKAVAERCGAAYTSMLTGGVEMSTTRHGFGTVTVTGGRDGLDDVAAQAGVPIPREIPPFDGAYARSILMLMDRTLYGHHVRAYLLRYSESYTGSPDEEAKHDNLTALVVALDAGLPETVESAVSQAMMAVSGMHRAVSFLSAPASAPTAASASGPVRFFTAIGPDSNSVADVYDAVAAL